LLGKQRRLANPAWGAESHVEPTMMTSSRAEAFFGLPDWARRITSQVEVAFHESLSGTWRPDGTVDDARVTLELDSSAPSAQNLLDTGEMRAAGMISLEGLAASVEVHGERHVEWDSGRIGLRLRFTADDGRPYLLVGGWAPGPTSGGEREPFSFRLETGDGTPVGHAVISSAGR
jgi:hypothetical protein